MKNEQRGVEEGLEGGRSGGLYIRVGCCGAEPCLARLVAPGRMEVDVCAGSGRFGRVVVGGWFCVCGTSFFLGGARVHIMWWAMVGEKRAVAGKQKFEGARGSCVATCSPLRQS